MIPPSALAGGFTRPVFDSQAVFRGVLDALSRPGRVVAVDVRVEPPPPLNRTAAAVIAALADEDTPVFLDADLAAAAAVAAWIGFHSGAPVTSAPSEAAFAVIGQAAALPPLDEFMQGTAEYPDRSTTVVLQVEGFEGPRALSLSGPGIRGAAILRPHPLPSDFIPRLAANRRLFPRGVDLVLAAPASLAALPRSVRIAEGAA